MQGVPFRKDPRDGQKLAFEKIAGSDALNIQLPTGYGKTFTACGIYSILHAQGKVDRLLVVTPRTAQHDQFVLDGPSDLLDAGVPGPHEICDIGYFSHLSLRKHHENANQAYCITIQSLTQSVGAMVVDELLNTGQWMIVFDEYHHFGAEATWGVKALSLSANKNCVYRLAMSATPYRKNDDNAFGRPGLIVKYREAVDEGSLKPLCAHSYKYIVEVKDGEGRIERLTTSQLVDKYGTGEDHDRHVIKRQMRWEPNYIAPLVSVPIERMLCEQLRTGHRLQVLIGAMSVAHAKMVCEQVRDLFPELTVDWVGTGEYGRADKENEEVLKKFCPAKNEDGKREHTLDVLVHVGMAGEGLDSQNVSEIIHLNSAGNNNSNNQENGRAARYLEGVTGNINFDSCSDYARNGYVGAAIMDAMDGEAAQACALCGELPCTCESTTTSGNSLGLFELPEYPAISVTRMELLNIDSGSPEVKRVQELFINNPEYAGVGITRENAMDDGNIEYVIECVKKMRAKEAEKYDPRAEVEKWKEQVNNGLNKLTRGILHLQTLINPEAQKFTAGDIKKSINTEKCRRCGRVANDVEVLKRHWEWLRDCSRELKESEELPRWLR
jgi:superfamily II DNA or RNA helicase